MSILIKSLFFSAALLCSFFLEKAMANQVNLLSTQTEVKDQQSRDTCAYFAISGLVESALKTQTGEDFNISEEYEIFRHKIINAWRPEVEFGDTYTILENLSKDLYFYEENELPYQKQSIDFTKPLSASDQSFFDLRQKKVPSVSFRSLKFKMLTQMWVKRSWSELVMNEINQGRPVVITLNVSIANIDDNKGTFTMTPAIADGCASGQLKCGGHAIVLVGYDDVQKVFMFKNSWGPKWGNKGYGYVTFDHVDKYSDQPLTAYFDKLTLPSVRRIQP